MDLSQQERKGRPIPLRKSWSGTRDQTPNEDLVSHVGRAHGHSEGAESGVLDPDNQERRPYKIPPPLQQAVSARLHKSHLSASHFKFILALMVSSYPLGE